MGIMQFQCKDCEKRFPPGFFRVETFQCVYCFRKAQKENRRDDELNKLAEDMVR